MKRLLGLCLGFAACTGLPLFYDLAHGDPGLPLFWSLFGLCGSAVLSLASKWIARVFLERDCGYYDT